MNSVFCRGIAFLLLAASLTACSGPSYRTTYYTLTADAEAEALPAAPFVGSLGVWPVRLPESLDHSGIVSRDGTQQVSVALYDVWAGDLQLAVTRVLAHDLSVLLKTHDVSAFPWDNRVRPGQQLKVVLERFGGERGGSVELRAKWRLLSGNGNQVLYSDGAVFSRKADGTSYDAYVSTLNQLLHQFAREVAEKVLEVEGGEE